MTDKKTEDLDNYPLENEHLSRLWLLRDELIKRIDEIILELQAARKSCVASETEETGEDGVPLRKNYAAAQFAKEVTSQNFSKNISIEENQLFGTAGIDYVKKIFDAHKAHCNDIEPLICPICKNKEFLELSMAELYCFFGPI